MKKSISVILVIAFLLLCAVGCGTDLTYGETHEDLSGVALLVDQVRTEAGSTTLKIIWRNQSQNQVTFGEPYTIERLEGNQWVSCSKKELNAFETVGYLLKPGQELSKTYTISDLFDVSQPGTYRFKSNCDGNTGAEKSESLTLWVEFTIDEPKETAMPYQVQYIRTDGYREGAQYPQVVIIRSVGELNRYYEDNKEIFDLERRENVSSDSTMGFLDACDRYDGSFFEKSYLVFVLLEEGSGSVRHEVRNVIQNADHQLVISVDRIVPEVGTCDMAQWHLILELSNSVEVQDANSVKVYVDGRLTYTEGKITNPQDDLGRVKYTGQWLDKEAAEKYEYPIFSDIVITEIYSDCFFARTVIPMPYVIKLNGSLSEDWCVGDQVICTYENTYYDIENNRVEVDLLTIAPSTWEPEPGVCYKPVIYLYPEEEMEVRVELTLDGKLTCTYPAYDNGWQVTAAPDGTLTDAKGQTYNYLYWEGETHARWDLTEGFCVKGTDTAVFLENALEKLGLTRREANEFIVYWLPQMEQNPYNMISFQTDIYTDAAKLRIDPAPDTMIRVFMAWQATDDYVVLPEQELHTPERNGFTVVEWGGTEVQ